MAIIRIVLYIYTCLSACSLNPCNGNHKDSPVHGFIHIFFVREGKESINHVKHTSPCESWGAPPENVINLSSQRLALGGPVAC